MQWRITIESSLTRTSLNEEPHDPMLRLVVNHRGQLDPFVAEPQMNLANAAQLAKLAKHERDRFPHTLIRIHPDLVTVDPHVGGPARPRNSACAATTILPCYIVFGGKPASY